MSPLPNTDERLLRILSERTEPDGDCLLWTGPTNRYGYARLRRYQSGQLLAHRVAYELARGDIPDGMDLDHLCHTLDKYCVTGPSCKHRRCLNADHMEPVTRAENSKRGGWRRDKCANGHEYDEANTYTGAGYRHCRACNASAQRKRKARLSERAA